MKIPILIQDKVRRLNSPLQVYFHPDLTLLHSHPIPKCFLTQISISTEINVSSRVSLFMFPAVVSLPRLQLRGLNLGSQQNWTKLEEIGTNWA